MKKEIFSRPFLTVTPKQKTTAMFPGMKVRCFQKPLTNEDLEGICTLVTFDSRSEGYGTERWDVRFDEDGDRTFIRDVKAENVSTTPTLYTLGENHGEKFCPRNPNPENQTANVHRIGGNDYIESTQ